MKNKLNEWKLVIFSFAAGLIGMAVIANCSTSTSATLTYVQVERLARPAINEGLVTQNTLLNAFNSIAPSVDLMPAATTVLADAKNTLTALFAGACFISGQYLGLSAGNSNVVPAGQTCNAVGVGVFSAGAGTPLSATTQADASGYISNVVAGFLPDVMRIDTTRASGYSAATCQASGQPAMLCGGRLIGDNVMDITYGYLLAGDATGALFPVLSNGTSYLGTSGNTNQGHTPVLTSFPYVPGPYTSGT